MLPLAIAAASSSAEPVVLFDAYQPAANGLVERRKQWDELHAVAVLQGIVNRARPRLYLNLVGENGRIDRFWWGVMRGKGGWLEGRPVESVATFDDLLRRFRKDVKGLIVWDEKVAATANVASTLCGLEDTIPVRYDSTEDSLYSKLQREGWPIVKKLVRDDGSALFTGAETGSAKCDAYRWALREALRNPKFDTKKLGYYPDAFWLQRPKGLPIDRTLLSNQDYFVAHRAFLFDLDSWDDEAPDDEAGQKPGTDAETLQTILRAAFERNRGAMAHVGGFTPWDLKYTDFTGMKHGGVETEWRYAEILSCFNAYMDADAPALGPMANASFFQHLPLAPRYVQRPIPNRSEMRLKGWIAANGRPAAKRFVAFYVGDYDSAAWLYRMMPEIWTDPARGEAPLCWAFNPNLADRFPLGMTYARQTATPNDSFMAGDSGAGYLNPGYLVPPRRWSGFPSGLEAWKKHCETYYRRWDLGVTGFVIDGNAPAMSPEALTAYARFSRGGVVAQKVPERSLVDGVPFLRMSSDLDRDNLEASVQTVLREVAEPGPSFHLFRTILASPSWYKKLIESVRAKNPDVEFVDARVLLDLVRRDLASSRSARMP